jgi:uncharacterized membrane protein
MIAIFEFGSGLYKVLGILHIIAVVVAFGPLFIYPSLRRAGETATIAKMHMRLALPALALVWVLGMGLAGASDNVVKVSDGWVSAAILIWAVLMVVSWFMIRPAITDQSDRATGLLAAGTGITHLLLVVAMWLMVFKPGA